VRARPSLSVLLLIAFAGAHDIDLVICGKHRDVVFWRVDLATAFLPFLRFSSAPIDALTSFMLRSGLEESRLG
jgi:hypothetical protein